MVSLISFHISFWSQTYTYIHIMRKGPKRNCIVWRYKRKYMTDGDQVIAVTFAQGNPECKKFAKLLVSTQKTDETPKLKMTVSRLEINLQRLLRNTENLSRENSTLSDWRLEKYVKALNDLLSELRKRSKKPDDEKLNEYNRRIEFLKILVDSQKIDNPVERVVALQMMSHGVSTPDGNISREIHQKTTSKYNLDIRNELFGKENSDKLRSRNQVKSTGEDLDSLIKYHQSVQERIVNDMLLLTRDLKEQTKQANSIIKKDIETLHKSTGLADQNLAKLKIESARLEEHNRKAWRCWMWVLIFVVMIIFIFMVLFMKVT